MSTTTPKQPSIALTTTEVRALLDTGQVTLRRLLKPQPTPDPWSIDGPSSAFGRVPEGAFIPTSKSGKVGIFTPDLYLCPFGRVGDRLLALEPWQTWTEYNDIAPSAIPQNRIAILYIADRENMLWDSRKRHVAHMPRWASRLSLEITGVRVEQAPDEAGALKWWWVTDARTVEGK